MKRTLFVKKTNTSEISKMWGTRFNLKGFSFVRCNRNGVVNWNTTSVYRPNELVGKKVMVVE